MLKPSKLPRIDETKFLPAEAYFAPLVVRSGSICHQPERQQQINDAIATIKAQRSERRNELLILNSQQNQEEKENSADVRPSADNDPEASAALEREIRQAQSLWLNKSGWAEYCDERAQENILELIALQMRGSLAPSEFAAAIREVQRAVTGTKSREGGYYRPQAHPWKLPGGW